MKTIFSVFSVIMLSVSAFSQCPQSGLRIQSAVCDSARNLMVKSLSCSSLEVKWKGNASQTYVVKTVCTDMTTNKAKETEVAKISCDKYGYCSAALPVSAGAKVNWEVTALCMAGKTVFYSSKSVGKEIYIPYCNKENKEAATVQSFRVYPNPSAGYLTIDISAQSAANIDFTIFDVSGKKVFHATESAKQNQHKMDLRKLQNGAYMLEAKDGNMTRTARFELIKN